MSVQEIQLQLEKLTPEELTEIEKRDRLLRAITAPGYRERIAEAHRRMDAGHKVTEEQLDAALEARRKQDRL